MRDGRVRRRSVGAVVGCLIALTACGSDDDGGQEPKHQVSLAVYQGESRQGERLGAAELTCEPTGGNHPQATRACDELARVSGDPTKLPTANKACAEIFQPVTAVATGTWGNSRVDFEKTYGNSCELSAATGAVFDFPLVQ